MLNRRTCWIAALLIVAAALVAPAAAAPKQPPAASIDEKLADFYVVRQIDGQVVFSAIYPRAQEVQIAGDFNGWNPASTTLQRVDEKGKWQLKMPLDKGLYRYRLVVDGQWQQDPYNDWIEMNPYGEFNSVLNIK